MSIRALLFTKKSENKCKPDKHILIVTDAEIFSDFIRIKNDILKNNEGFIFEELIYNIDKFEFIEVE